MSRSACFQGVGLCAALAALALLVGAGVASAAPARVLVAVDGTTRSVTADTNEYVGSVVQRLGIRLGANDRVYPRPWAEVFDGLEIEVVRVRVDEVTESVKVPYPVVLRDDPSLPFGKVRLVSADWSGGTLTQRVRRYHRSDGPVEAIPLGYGSSCTARPKVFAVGTKSRPQQPPFRELVMSATAYSPEEPGLGPRTSIGLPAGRGVVAVDPRVIPYGTKMIIEGYGPAVAGDCGGAIKGNRIDLCFDTLREAYAFGTREVRVRFVW